MNQLRIFLGVSFVLTLFVKVRAQVDVSNSTTTDSFKIQVPQIDIIEKTYQAGGLTMTQNQYKVMPASFQDPTRILLKYPGFSTQNDGANAIVFRGMPPEYTRWQLFGADIVNPNHLANAGTANDLATGNAGGVNALSGSVLDYYHFEPNPADISYADVMAGVSNMKMAPKIKPFIDINLIGLEAGYGHLINNKSIYASYRYSFVGLLDKLGVNFGGEKIGYQDLSWMAELSKTNTRNLKIFGTLGSSTNAFSAVNLVDEAPKKFKDIQNINYSSKLTIVGAQFTYGKNNKSFQSTVVYSSRKDDRSAMIDPSYPDSLIFYIQPMMIMKNQLLSMHQQYEVIDRDYDIKLGLRMNMQEEEIDANHDLKPFYTIYPYFHFKYFMNQKTKLNVGLASLYDTQTKDVTLEPTFGLFYQIKEYLSTNLQYRYASFRDFTASYPLVQPFDYHRLKSHNLQVDIKYQKNNILVISALFLHRISDFTTFSTMSNLDFEHFSSFNGQNFGYDQINNDLLISARGKGAAKVYGFDFYAENISHYRKNTIQYGLNLSVFDSKYSLDENSDKYYNGKYNFGYTQSANLSYTKDISNDIKSRKIILSVSNHLRGGLREQMLNTSSIDHPTLYNYNTPFDQKFKPYHRLDFRIVYSKSKNGSKLSHRWSLDIQNLLNHENDAFRYYDPLLKGVFLQKQLGMIPVLSYRLEWSH